MIGIEKYTLRDGQTGWQVRHLVRVPAAGTKHSGTVHTRRFSCAKYGALAFQKALEWFENSYYQTAEIRSKSPTGNTGKLQEI